MKVGSKFGMGRWLWVMVAVLGCGAGRAVAAPEPYFNLSTYKSFAPGEKPKLHLYARNVDALEFRVYHIDDPDKFIAGLPQMHSFGDHRGYDAAVEKIDEETWLEKFHDWKQGLWRELKDFIRGQVSHRTRQALLQKQSGLARRSRIVGVAEFAQIPLLNDKQLVARWKQEMPPTFVSDNQVLPIDALPPGMYLVEATDAHRKAYTILLVSETALITRTVAGNVLAFAVDRKTGAPVAGAAVSLGLQGYPLAQKTTDAEGVAEFAAPAPKAKAAAAGAENDPADGASNDFDAQKMWVIARHGGDVALVAPYGSSFTSERGTTYTSFVYTDRPAYRPGHTVHWKAVLRQYAENAVVLPKFSQAHVVIADAQEKSILDKVVAVSATGTLNGDVTLAKDAALGSYSVTVSGVGVETAGAGMFLVEEYRKPEYEVRVSAEKQHLLQGSANTMTIDSRYFFGEPVVGAKVKYTVQQSSHIYFEDADGDDVPHASFQGDEENDSEYQPPGNEEIAGTGMLDANGKLVVQVPTRFIEKEHGDKDYVVEAGVTDEAGREITGRYKFLATYGSFRVQVEPVTYFGDKDKPIGFHLTAVDYEGRPVATHIHLALAQTKYVDRKTVRTDAGSADATTGADGKATVWAHSSLGGAIEALATAETAEHRTVQDASWVYVAAPGDRFSDDSEQFGDTHQLSIIADKRSYAPGDTAHLSLVGDVAGFHAMITATGYTVEFRKTLSTEGEALTFDLPITKDSQPNLTVEAVFIKDNVLYQAHRSLKVPPAQQALQIEITAAANVFQPQQTAAYDVVTKDAAGRPVSAELSFGVVDEAIYALYPDHSGDLLKSMYPEREIYASFDSSLTYYFSGEAGDKTPMLAERRPRYRPMLAQVKPVNDAKAPHIRKDFPDTAFWAPDVHTDATGHARVTLKFPDSLTTWRATVRAITADSKAGSLVNRVIVRKNIIVRMGQPRFLRKGDVISVPVIVHNYLADAKAATLSLEAQGVDVVGGATQVVNVAAKGEASAVWKLRASSVGTAKLLAKAITNEESDALEVSLPVKPSGVQRTVNASGVIAGAGERSVAIDFPGGTDAAAHTLTVTVSPSIAGSMFGALDYLSTFPYGCTEQTMSSFLPNILIADATVKLGLVSTVNKNQLDTRIAAGFARLADYQHADGGWGWWKEDNSMVFMTAYVVSGYGLARHAGYDKAGGSLGQGVTFLQNTLKAHPRMLPELRAYTVYALAEGMPAWQDKKLLHSELDTLYERRNDLSAQGLAFTGLGMLELKDQRAQEIATLLATKAKKEGDLVSWPSPREPLLDIDADGTAEATGYALKFLVHAMPASPLLTGAAQWLVANRNQGSYWTSTEQTASVLMGLTDYVAETHELGGDADLEVLVNGTSVGKKHLAKSDVLAGGTLTVTLDADRLQAQGNTVKVAARGGGRAYFAVTGAYFSTDKSSYQQGTMSLNIARDYFKLVPATTDGNIVYNLEPLRGPVKQGDVLAVHLGVTGSPAKYLLIEDPIPAGAEFVQNEASYNIVGRPNAWGYWYTRREFHDDRAAIFATEFTKRQESFYLLKVINPGSYAISPASVAPMYQTGVQATTDELHLDVEEVH